MNPKHQALEQIADITDSAIKADRRWLKGMWEIDTIARRAVGRSLRTPTGTEGERAPETPSEPERPAPPLREPERAPVWPGAPDVKVWFVWRGGVTTGGVWPDGAAWTEETSLRWRVSRNPIKGLECRVYQTQHKGYDATEVWVVLANAYPDTGPVYFTDLTIDVGDTRYQLREGAHCILPRQVLAKRFVVGEDAALVRDYMHGSTLAPPAWAEVQCVGESDRILGVYSKMETGPYAPTAVFHPNGASPGGKGIWFEDWFQMPEGNELHSWVFRTVTDRHRIACLDRETGEPLTIVEPYSSTRVDQLTGFQQGPDKWCPYAEDMMGMSFDGQHLRRAVYSAAKIAPWCPWAREWLRWVAHDVTLDYSWEDIPKVHNFSKWGMAQRIDARDDAGRGFWAGREYVHSVHALFEASRWWPEAAAALSMQAGTIRDLADENGVCFAVHEDGNYAYYASWARSLGLSGPIAMRREIEFMARLYIDLGLTDELHKVQEWLVEHKGKCLNVDTGASVGLEEKGYWHMVDGTFGARGEWNSASKAVKACESRGVLSDIGGQYYVPKQIVDHAF